MVVQWCHSGLECCDERGESVCREGVNRDFYYSIVKTYIIHMKTSLHLMGEIQKGWNIKKESVSRVKCLRQTHHILNFGTDR